MKLNLRDTQRQRVYNAEYVITRAEKRWIGDRSMQAVKEFCFKVYNDPWFRTKYPHARPPERLVLHNGGGRVNAAAGFDYWMSFPRWARHEFVVLHEIAHLIHHQWDAMYPPHGAKFCTIHLDLVRHFMDFDTFLALRQAFIDKNVKFAL